MKRIIIGSLLTCSFALAACNKDEPAKGTAKAPLAATRTNDGPSVPTSVPTAALRDNIVDAVPLPPSMPKTGLVIPPAPDTGAPTQQQVGAAPEVYQGPTKGEETPEALAKALVAAAKRRDTKAFQDLTVCGRDIGLYFHKGLQVSTREKVALLSRKFITYTQQIPADGELIRFKPGLATDFSRGQGATVTMPGYLGSDIVVKAGADPKTLPLGRIVQIENRWKLLDF